MSVYSGVTGYVNGQSCVHSWDVKTSADIQEWIESNCQGMMHASAGNTDWAGSFAGYGGLPAVLPGEEFDFEGSLDGTDGISGTAIVDQVQITCNIESRTPIEWTVSFSGNGALTLGEVAGADDTTTIPALSSHVCKVSQGTVVADPAWTDIAGLRSWQLSLAAANQAYTNSDTAGAVRRAAGNLSLNWQMTAHLDDPANIILPNTLAGLRFYTAAAAYWEVLWGIFGEAGGVQVDRKSGAIVGLTYSGRFVGKTLIGSTATVGSIKKPGGATWWPPA